MKTTATGRLAIGAAIGRVETGYGEAARPRASAYCVRIDIPPGFERITRERAVINAFERARGLSGEWFGRRESMTRQTVEVCERGFAITGEEYGKARAAVESMRREVGMHFFRDADLPAPPPGKAASPGEGWHGLRVGLLRALAVDGDSFLALRAGASLTGRVAAVFSGGPARLERAPALTRHPVAAAIDREHGEPEKHRDRQRDRDRHAAAVVAPKAG